MNLPQINRNYFLFCLGPVICWFGAYFLINMEAILAFNEWIADLAVNALYIERAKNGQELLGPYSRYNFHHPGPISFYLLAAISSLLFFLKENALSTAQLLLNFAFISYTAHYLYKFRKELPILWICAFLFLMIGFRADIFVNFWGPFQLIFPMAAFLVGGTVLSNGNINSLFGTVFAGMFMCQTHIGAAIVIIPLAGFMFGAYRKKNVKTAISKKEKKWLYASLTLVMISILLMLIEEISSNYGNISRLYDHFILGKRPFGDQSIAASSISDILIYLTHFIGVSTKFFFGKNGGMIVSIVLVVGFIRMLFIQKPFLKTLSKLILLSFVFAFIGAIISQANLKSVPYILYFMHGASSLLLVLSLIGIADVIKTTFPIINLHYERFSSRYFAGIGILLLLFSFYLLTQFYTFSPKKNTLIPTLYEQISLEEEAYYLHFRKGSNDEGQWEIAAPLALRLVKSGKKVFFPPEFGFLFGDQMTTDKLPQNIYPIFLSQLDTTKYKAKDFDNTQMDLGYSPPIADFPFEIQHSDEYPHFYFGWSGIYEEYKYTNGQLAKLFFTLADTVQIPKKLNLTIRLASIKKDQTVHISLDDQEVNTIQAKANDFQTYTFALNIHNFQAGKTHSISFHTPNAFYRSRFHSYRSGIQFKSLTIEE